MALALASPVLHMHFLGLGGKIIETDQVLAIQVPALGLHLAVASCLAKHRGRGSCPVGREFRGARGGVRGSLEGMELCCAHVPGGNRVSSL